MLSLASVINIHLFQSKLVEAAAPANPESHTLKKSKRKNQKHCRDKKTKSGIKTATPSAAPDDDADNGYIILMNQLKPQGASASEKLSKVGNGYERIPRDSE